MDPDVQGVNFKVKWIFSLGPKIQILFEWGEMSGSEASFKQQLSDSLWRSTILPETVEVVSINSSVSLI